MILNLDNCQILSTENPVEDFTNNTKYEDFLNEDSEQLLNEINSEIDSLEQKVNKGQEYLKDAISAQAQGLASSISNTENALVSKHNSNNLDILENSKKLSDLQLNLNTMKNKNIDKITEIEKRLAELNNEISRSTESQATINQVQGIIKTLEDNQKALKLENKAINDNLALINSELNSKIDNALTNDSELSNSIDDLKKELNAVNKGLNSNIREVNQEINDMDTVIEEDNINLNNELNNLAGSINNKFEMVNNNLKKLENKPSTSLIGLYVLLLVILGAVGFLASKANK